MLRPIGCWNLKTKTVDTSDPNAKAINKEPGQIKADLERTFDLIQARDGIATPEAVIDTCLTPLNDHDLKRQKTENFNFSEDLDALVLEIMDRAVTNPWVSSNVSCTFQSAEKWISRNRQKTNVV